MITNSANESLGSWVIHHGNKISNFEGGSSKFSAIDEAAKVASFYAKIGATDDTTVPNEQLKAMAIASSLNPGYQLDGLLSRLEAKKLIKKVEHGIEVLGFSMRGATRHAANLYIEAKPKSIEDVSIELAEISSEAPIRKTEALEQISDTLEISLKSLKKEFKTIEAFGLIDKIEDGDDAILFNGNLFRRNGAEKTEKLLSSLSQSEVEKMNEYGEQLLSKGCLSKEISEKILGEKLFTKLASVGFYDQNRFSNEFGLNVFVTSPGAFHKYVDPDPMIDDCFDMAKMLVTSLTYGMTASAYSRGRIQALPKLMKKLIDGAWVGPATAIGNDYRILQKNGVVQIKPDENNANMFKMRLRKIEVGKIALQVLQQGSIDIDDIPINSASMPHYFGPEVNRELLRKIHAEDNSLDDEVIHILRSGDRY